MHQSSIQAILYLRKVSESIGAKVYEFFTPILLVNTHSDEAFGVLQSYYPPAESHFLDESMRPFLTRCEKKFYEIRPYLCVVAVHMQPEWLATRQSSNFV